MTVRLLATLLSFFLVVLLTPFTVNAALSKQQQIDMHQALILEAIKSTPINCALLTDHASKLEQLTTQLPSKLYYFRANCANDKKDYLTAYQNLNSFFKQSPQKDEVYTKALILYSAVEEQAKRIEQQQAERRAAELQKKQQAVKEANRKELEKSLKEFNFALCKQYGKFIKKNKQTINCEINQKSASIFFKQAISSNLFRTQKPELYDQALYHLVKNQGSPEVRAWSRYVFKPLTEEANPLSLVANAVMGFSFVLNDAKLAEHYLTKALEHKDLPHWLEYEIKTTFVIFGKTMSRDKMEYYNDVLAMDVLDHRDQGHLAATYSSMGTYFWLVPKQKSVDEAKKAYEYYKKAEITLNKLLTISHPEINTSLINLRIGSVQRELNNIRQFLKTQEASKP
jgi:tetratricopeptide (TPR) repeat protein